MPRDLPRKSYVCDVVLFLRLFARSFHDVIAMCFANSVGLPMVVFALFWRSLTVCLKMVFARHDIMSDGCVWIHVRCIVVSSNEYHDVCMVHTMSNGRVNI